MGRLRVHALVDEVVVAEDQFDFRPDDRARILRELAQPAVGNVERHPALARHEIGELQGGVQRETDGPDVDHRELQRRGVPSRDLAQLLVELQRLNGVEHFGAEIEARALRDLDEKLLGVLKRLVDGVAHR